MESALRIKTRVLPGKRIEITAPGLVEGEIVEILVVPPKRRGRSVLDLLKSTAAPGAFKTADEVDEYIRKERDSWDS